MPISRNQLLEIANKVTTQRPDGNTTTVLKANRIWHSTDHDKLVSKRKRRRYKNKQRKLEKRKTEVCRHLPSVVNMNLRSVVNKTNQLRAFQDDSKHNIICVTETWLTPNNKASTMSER
jgi:hypothetical protein